MDPDALYAILRHLADKWGDYGYRVAELRPVGYGGGAAATIRHSDGSEFAIVTNRHGYPVGDGDTVDAALADWTAKNAASAE